MIPNTNLVLVVADTTCPCYSARISVTPTKVKSEAIRRYDLYLRQVGCGWDPPEFGLAGPTIQFGLAGPTIQFGLVRWDHVIYLI